MEFRRKLKVLIRKCGLSQDKLAQRIGVSQGTVSGWTTGKVFPDLRDLVEMANVFDVGVDYLADDRQDEPSSPEITETERVLLAAARQRGVEDSILWLMELPKKTAGTYRAELPRRDSRNSVARSRGNDAEMGTAAPKELGAPGELRDQDKAANRKGTRSS